MNVGFDRTPVMVPLEKLLKTRKVHPNVKTTAKYQRILASIREVGIIEPLIVHPQKGSGAKGAYVLLDGHLRAEALKELGVTEARCLVSTEDEGYTYNRHVNRLSALQEHFMLRKALDEGVPEERLAGVLHVDIQKIREKRDLLRGICSEAVELLRHRDVGSQALRFVRLVKPFRQIEMAELMGSANNFTSSYAKALYLSTQQAQLLEPDKPKEGQGVDPIEIARMEKEMESLEQDFRVVEESYSKNMLNLVVARDYLVRVLDNARVVRFLSQRHPEILSTFQTLAEATSLEA